jgi:hypothetical protein
MNCLEIVNVCLLSTHYKEARVGGEVPQSLQLQAQVRLASLDCSRLLSRVGKVREVVCA